MKHIICKNSNMFPDGSICMKWYDCITGILKENLFYHYMLLNTSILYRTMHKQISKTFMVAILRIN